MPWNGRSEFEGALADCRAIIISANLMEAEGIARTITAHGGLAEIARTAEEAAAAAHARGQGYNVVLVDASLERVDGRLLKRLRKAGRRTRRRRSR
jgi:DNA-binding response OmpR family regulator